jgi:hypothetical protein
MTDIHKIQLWLASRPTFNEAERAYADLWAGKPEIPFTPAEWNTWVLDIRRFWIVHLMIELLQNVENGDDLMKRVSETIYEAAAPMPIEAPSDEVDETVPFTIDCPHCCTPIQFVCDNCGSTGDQHGTWSEPIPEAQIDDDWDDSSFEEEFDDDWYDDGDDDYESPVELYDEPPGE